MSDQYDLIVLGSGLGGYVAAIGADELVLNSWVVEGETLAHR